jgi:hypothetical protein
MGRDGLYLALQKFPYPGHPRAFVILLLAREYRATGKQNPRTKHVATASFAFAFVRSPIPKYPTLSSR